MTFSQLPYQSGKVHCGRKVWRLSDDVFNQVIDFVDRDYHAEQCGVGDRVRAGSNKKSLRNAARAAAHVTRTATEDAAKEIEGRDAVDEQVVARRPSRASGGEGTDDAAVLQVQDGHEEAQSVDAGRWLHDVWSVAVLIVAGLGATACRSSGWYTIFCVTAVVVTAMMVARRWENDGVGAWPSRAPHV